jgi:hypothetical protein
MPRAGDAALDRAHGAIADLRRLLIAEAAGADQDEHLAMGIAQSPVGTPEVAEFQRCFLARRRRFDLDGHAVEGYAARPILAALVVVEVAQDREHPGLEVRPGAKLVCGAERANDRIMDQVIGLLPVARQRPRERPQMRDDPDQIGSELGRLTGGKRVVHC